MLTYKECRNVAIYFLNGELEIRLVEQVRQMTQELVQKHSRRSSVFRQLDSAALSVHLDSAQKSDIDEEIMAKLINRFKNFAKQIEIIEDLKDYCHLKDQKQIMDRKESIRVVFAEEKKEREEHKTPSDE